MVTKYLKKKIAIALVAAMAIGGVTPTQIVPSFKMENVKAGENETPEPAATPAPIVDASFDYASKMLKIAKKVTSSFEPYAIGESVYYQTVPYTGTNFETAGTLNTSAKKWTAIEIGYAEASEGTAGLYGKYNYVDFSWLSCTKKQDLYVAKDAAAVEAGEETPVKITIDAQNVDLSIKFYGTLPTGTDEPGADYYVGNDVTGYLVSVAKATGKEKVKLTDTQYKTENGEWTAVTSALSNELLKYVNKGVKLQFRVAPSNNNVAGKAITVSVPAKANGPKVTVDYNKQQITFPKGSEYILSTNYGVGANWKAAPLENNKVKALYFDDEAIGYNGTDAKTFYVRTVAKQNKACSKITVVTIGAQVTVAEDVVYVANGTDLLATAYDADNADKVFIQYKTPYDKSSGLLITNNSNKAYQVAVVKKTDIEGYYTEDANGNKNFSASKMIIGENTSKIKFTDVKAYTVNKTTGVTKAGSATIATKDFFKTEGSEISDYVILYRQYDKSSKTNTAPAKTYMVDMAAVLEQAVTLKLKDADEALNPYVADADATANIKASQELTLTLDKQTNTTSVAKVTIWKDADCKQKNTEVRATVTKDDTNKNVNKITLTVSNETIKTAYVKVVWEGVEEVYYISYAK